MSKLNEACDTYAKALRTVREVEAMTENFEKMPVGAEFRCKELLPENYQRASCYLSAAARSAWYDKKDYGVKTYTRISTVGYQIDLPDNITDIEELQKYISAGGNIWFSPRRRIVRFYKKTK